MKNNTQKSKYITIILTSLAAFLLICNCQDLMAQEFEINTDGNAIFKGNIGIGTTTPNAPLQFDQSYSDNRKIVLFQSANNEHQFYGFGISAATLRYHVGTTEKSHVFYAGTSTTTSDELMRIKGNGSVHIGTPTTGTYKLNVNGSLFASSANFSGALSASTATFDGALNGNNATFNGGLTVKGTSTSSFSGKLSAKNVSLLDNAPSKPVLKSVYGNSLPVAYGLITDLGQDGKNIRISSNYGIEKCVRNSKGQFTVTLRNKVNGPAVVITGWDTNHTPIPSYYPYDGNLIDVKFITYNGNAGNVSGFSIVVFGTAY